MTLNEWVVNGSTGRSSMTMWAALTGSGSSKYKSGNFDVPYDSSDFKRCYDLVHLCNVPKDDLQKVVQAFPFWKPFIDNWGKLCSMFESGEGSKPPYKLYDFITELEGQAKILGGWKKTGLNSWELKKENGEKTETVQFSKNLSISI